MTVRGAIAVLASAVAIAIVLYFLGNTRSTDSAYARQGSSNTSVSDFSNTLMDGSRDRASELPAAELPGVRLSAQPGHAPAATELPLVPQVVQAFMHDSTRLPRMRDVPALSEDAQAELARRYATESNVTNQYVILRILAYAGSPDVVPLIINLFRGQFRARSLSAGEEGHLINALALLGLSARTEPAALQFLLLGVSAKGWQREDLWMSARDESSLLRGLRVRCLHGLAVSEQPAAIKRLDELREDAETVIRLHLEGPLVDAAFIRDMIAEHGLEDALDFHVWPPQPDLHSFIAWKGTSNGIWWTEWRLRQAQQRMERRTESQ